MAYSILHLSPTYYAEASVVGGGEKYIHYMSSAIRTAAALRGLPVTDSLLVVGDQPGQYELAPGFCCTVIQGRPWDPLSVKPRDLRVHLTKADIVIVHQCLSSFGLFVASHSRLQQKPVIGIDEGGGEHALVHHSAEVGRIFDAFHAYSRFCAGSFTDLDGRVVVIPGPVDTAYYTPDTTIHKDPNLILAVGRILPHKGFERIIRALPDNLRLVIAGGVHDRAYYSYLRKLPNFSRVEIKERLTDPEVRLLMQSASLFVHASTHIDYRGTYYAKPELLGLAPLEALSAGTPALVSSAGALPELAGIQGCTMFRDDGELRELLSAHVKTSYPTAATIHADVELKYGLQTFGLAFLDALDDIGVFA
jgi:glycosyltransferase involved in cell wall biosynthesis